MMGASLPAAARWIESTGRGASWWGLLYGGNTAGAVFGCLFAGFYVLRVYNQAMGTYVAVLINLAVALGAWVVASRTPAQVEAPAKPDEKTAASGDVPGSPASIYLAITLSGAAALGGEVVWTRLMGALMGSTTYVFSIILAVFLIGLAIGSSAGAWLARTLQPRMALGWCQALLVLATAWSTITIAESLPYWPINPFLTTSPWFTFQIDMARALWTLLPPTLLWGASFPLALAAVAGSHKDPARSVGAVYAWNTLGASDERTIQSELATFFAAFPNGTVWANMRDGEGYDMVFMGQVEPLKIDLDEIEQRFRRDDYARVRESLAEVGFGSPLALFRTYTGRRRDLGLWFGNAEITRDRDLRLMYLAGWGINSYMADSIYRTMLSYRQVPRDIFTGSPERVETLLRAISLPGMNVNEAQESDSVAP